MQGNPRVPPYCGAMKHVQFGGTQQQVPAVVAGMMRIAEKSDAEIRSLYQACRSVGVDFFDHADIYGFNVPGGGYHLCERRFRDALGLGSAERGEIMLQTKTGIVDEPRAYDLSHDHIVSSVEESLRALGTDYVDVLLLHRPDALVEPEEVARAFQHLESSGKVRMFGVSNHTPRQIDLLKTAVEQPLVVNQMQLSPVHAAMISQGLAANMYVDDAISRDGGALEHARINNITLQAWSPVQGPNGVFLGDPSYPELNAEIDRLATTYEVTPDAIVTAWFARHPADMQVVLGTTRPQRVLDAASGADLTLTRAEWYALLGAAGHHLP